MWRASVISVPLWSLIVSPFPARALCCLQPFRINLLDVATGATYHRCVYLLAAKEPQLMHAATSARAAFGMPESEDYMPHLSLLCADMEDGTRTNAATAAVGRLYGERADYSTLLLDPGFTASYLSLWFTPADDLSLASWRRVAEWPLGGGGMAAAAAAGD